MDASGYNPSTTLGCTAPSGLEQNTEVTLNQGLAEIRGVSDNE